MKGIFYMLKKNDIIPLEIVDITGQGSGIGRLNGMAVFVPMTAVGDIINAHILKVKKNYAFGKIENIETPSNMRITPDCDCYTQCGGCVYRHISYDEELKIKQRRVLDALTRIGKLSDFNMHNIIGCDTPNGYRNKTQIPIGKDKNGFVQMGFYGSHSHRITGTGECMLQNKEFNEIVLCVKKIISENNVSIYNEENHKGIMRHLYIRQGSVSREIMVCFVVNSDSLPCSEKFVTALTNLNKNIKSIVLNINKDKTNVILGKQCKTVFGSDFITDELCGLKFNISPLSFYQVNHDQTEKLYAKAREYAELSGDEFLIDLYCGTGTIGLSMSTDAKKIVGIEIIPQAIDNAIENSKINNISNADFYCMDSAEAAKKFVNNGERPDVIIIDPPRKGCDLSVIESICKMSPKRIVYVSCEPETLARDLAVFAEKDYIVKDVAPVDMFPRTASVETVVKLCRKSQ